MSPEALTKLPRYRFIAQVTHRGEPQRPFALGGVRVEDVLGEAPVARRELRGPERTRPRRGDRRPRSLAHLDSLDDRILAALRNGVGQGLARARRSGEERQGRSGPVAYREEARVTPAPPVRAASAATEILASLAQHRVLSTPQIRAIHCPDRSPRWAAGCWRRLARRRPGRLRAEPRSGRGTAAALVRHRARRPRRARRRRCWRRCRG